MKPQITAKAEIRNSKIAFEEKERVRLGRALPLFEGKEIEIIIREPKRPKSSKIRGYYWAVVIPFVTNLLNQEGFNATENDIHEFLKSKFNRKSVINQQTGEVIDFPASTESNSPDQDKAYLDAINQFVGENFNTELPSSDSSVSFRYTGE